MSCAKRKSQIDRHNTYRQLNGLFFPHHDNPMNPLRNTLIDGELVIDIDPHTNQVCPHAVGLAYVWQGRSLLQETLRFLAFDCLVVDDQNVMSRPLDKRYGVCLSASWLWLFKVYRPSSVQRLRDWFYKPYAKMLRDHPYMTNSQPFGCVPAFLFTSIHVADPVQGSKLKRSISHIMSKRCLISTFLPCNMNTMASSILVSTRHILLEQM
jgi:mRNA guanylyltransferase